MSAATLQLRGQSTQISATRPLWQRSSAYSWNRKIVKLGAFAKWARENPDEHKRIESNYRRSMTAGNIGPFVGEHQPRPSSAGESL